MSSILTLNYLFCNRDIGQKNSKKRTKEYHLFCVSHDVCATLPDSPGQTCGLWVPLLGRRRIWVRVSPRTHGWLLLLRAWLRATRRGKTHGPMLPQRDPCWVTPLPRLAFRGFGAHLASRELLHLLRLPPASLPRRLSPRTVSPRESRTHPPCLCRSPTAKSPTAWLAPPRP